MVMGALCAGWLAPFVAHLGLPRRGREKRERGAGGSCHLTCECSGAACGL